MFAPLLVCSRPRFHSTESLNSTARLPSSAKKDSLSGRFAVEQDDGFRRRQWLLEEIMIQFAYPRLDINVTKGVNHLLKSPFCIHPRTGKICIPFNPKSVDKFCPAKVPTITKLIQEINSYDSDLKKHLTEDEISRNRVKGYMKTSLNKSVQVFEEFMRKLEDSWKGKEGRSDKIDISMEF